MAQADRDRGESTARLKAIEVAQARLEYDEAVSKLRDADLRSPLDGVIVHLPISEGDTVGPGFGGGLGSPSAVVADVSAYVVEVEADENEAAVIASGQSALVFLRSQPGPLKAQVQTDPVLRRIASGRAAPAAYSVVIGVSDAPDRPGFAQSARVDIAVTARHNVPIVPLAAIVMFGGKHYVIDISTSGRFTPAEVVVGAMDDNFAELVSGPPLGTQVAVGSSEHLRRAAFGRAALEG
jgi:multidrug efflux pump subunit AcrA (membrane-fusion protein)